MALQNQERRDRGAGMLKGAPRYDAIIIGAGHNGLVCAAKLAKSGKSVVVLEAESVVGGAAVTREFADGFSVSACAHLLYQLQPAVREELDLELEFASEDLPTFVLSTTSAPVRYRNGEVSGVSDGDAIGYAAFHEQMAGFARLLNRQMTRIPPRLGTRALRDWLSLVRLGFDVRRLGRAGMRELLRRVAMNMHDELTERFESAGLRGGLSFDAVLGAQLGPRSPGTVLTYLYRLATGARLCQPMGGMGSVTSALEKRAQALGATVLTGRTVNRVVVENGRVAGVECDGGDRFASLTVVSNADPARTVMNLVGAQHFETRFVHRVSHLRSAGNVAKLHLALDGLPAFAGVEKRDLTGRLLIAADEDCVERAFNPAKYGEFSPEPVMEVTLPSLRDGSLAPAGKHVLSANVMYAPYRLKGGWTDRARRDFMQAIMRQLQAYAPGIEQRILASELLTPHDIEQQFRVTGGHWHHVELAFDQFLFVRPVAGAAQYRLPLEGLFLCGAGAHPGGGVTGAAGYNAARAVLHQERIA